MGVASIDGNLVEATSRGSRPTDTALEDPELRPAFTRLQGGLMQASVSTSDSQELLRSLGQTLSAHRLLPKTPAAEVKPPAAGCQGVRPDFATMPLRAWSAPELQYWFKMPDNRDFAALYSNLWEHKSGRVAAGFIDALRQNDYGYLEYNLITILHRLAVYDVICLVLLSDPAHSMLFSVQIEYLWPGLGL